MGKVISIGEILQSYLPVPEAGCWIWTGCWFPSGYGKAPSGVDGRSLFAHRLFYTQHKGDIPEGMLVCHKCDTPICVNPDHLFLGTILDNNRDRKQKGRYSGKWNPNWKHGRYERSQP